MNNDDLFRKLSKREGISLKTARNLYKAFIEVVGQTLKSENKAIFSDFGTFVTFKYPSKTVRDPRNRDRKILLLPTNVIKWHPSTRIKKLLKPESMVESVKSLLSGDQLPSKAKDPEPNTEAHVEKSSFVPITKSPDFTIENPVHKEENLEVPVTIKHSPSDSDQQAVKVDTPAKDHAGEEVLIKTVEKSDKPDEATKMPEEISAKTEKDTTELEETNSKEGQDLWGKLRDEPKDDVQNTKDQAATTDSSFNDVISKMEKLSAASYNRFSKKEPETTPEDTSKIQKNQSADVGASSGQETTQNKQDAVENKTTAVSFETFTDRKQAEIPKVDDSSVNQNAMLDHPKTEFVDVTAQPIDKEILSLIPEDFARKYQVIPLTQKEGKIVVAMIDPEDLETIELIKKQTGSEITPKLTIQADLNQALDQYSGVETEVKDAMAETENIIGKEKKGEVKTQELAEDAPVTRIVGSIIKRAVREKASDIHLEPAENGLGVRFRIDGILEAKVNLPKDVQASIISRVKILSGIKIDESRLPQDGRIQMTIDNRPIDFRVSSMPTAYGEKIVMRILDKSSGVLSLEQLGLRGRGFDAIEKSIHQSHGMTLVTGPTGSGKTTTLYAMIERLLSITTNIVTLEDPIEYRMPGINQSQVNAAIDYTFANGLRSILRQDPDVVMVGEIRDRDTAEMAVNAALTGHVVLSTLHTNDASGAGPRLIDMGVEPFLITSSLNSIIGQRLTRKICQKCKEETSIPEVQMKEIVAEIDKMPVDIKEKRKKSKLQFFKGKGCADCHQSGYKGRLGIFEVLVIDEAIETLLLNRSTASKITETAIKNGMLTMKQDGIDKTLDGLTTIEEVLRVTKD